uniref:(California timema) hypothetical protein n=1 Tax=Timema californicum TaxID=61474 RepID=A0A7R9PCZ8_TIMCA|nr:unnamed protein product [Timema californicum]
MPSGLFKVLYIVHEGCQLLDSYHSFPAKEMLESCTLLCLQLIQKALNLQQRFLGLLTSAGSNLLLTGLSKLLLDINPRSGQPDNLLNITNKASQNIALDTGYSYATSSQQTVEHLNVQINAIAGSLPDTTITMIATKGPDCEIRCLVANNTWQIVDKLTYGKVIDYRAIPTEHHFKGRPGWSHKVSPKHLEPTYGCRD